MGVHSSLMQQDRCCSAINLTNHDRLSLADILNHDRVVAAGTQGHALRGIRVHQPPVRPVGLMQLTLVDQKIKQLGDITKRSKAVAARKGKLKCRTAQVPQQDRQVVGIDQPHFRGAFEEEARMGDHELIQRRRRSYQNGHRDFAAPPRTTGLLPHAGNRAGVAGDHRRAELADVDAQLKRVRGNHAAHRSLAQAALDLAPFER